MQALSTGAPPRTSAKPARRLGPWSTATAAALVGAATLTLTVAAGAADAETRDPCADLAHWAQSSMDIATNFLGFGNVLLNLGFSDLALEQFDMGNYFVDAAALYYSDYENMGC